MAEVVAIAGITLLVLGLFFIVGNVASLTWMVVTRGSTSLLPPFGAFLAFAGSAMLPALGWKLGLLAFVLDPSCSLVVTWVVLSRLKRALSR